MSRYDCRQARQSLERQLEGPLPDRDQALLDAHLAICESCGELVQLWSAVTEEAARAPIEPIVHRRRKSAFRRVVKLHRGVEPSRTKVRAVLIGVAATVLVVWVGWVLWKLIPRPDGGVSADAVADGSVDAEPERGTGPDVVTEDLAEPRLDQRPVDPGSTAVEGGDLGDSASSSIAGTERTSLQSGGVRGGTLDQVDPTALQLALQRGDLDEAGRLSAADLLQRPDDPETINGLALLAQAYRGAGRDDEAVEVYLRLIDGYPDSEAAANAHVALGQLKLGVMDRPSEAVVHFDAYLARRPFGLLAEDARLGRLRSQVALGQDAKVLASSEEYLAFHPEGSATPEVLLARGDACRATEDCDKAAVVYQRVLERGADAHQEARARQGLESCGR